MTRVLLTIVIVATAWSLSSYGYYWLGPVVGAEIGYNDAPVLFAVYYAAWALLVFLVFREPFRNWVNHQFQGDRVTLAMAMLLVFTIYALFVIPRLPASEWVRSETPVEFFYANAQYFLPKSVEILFQQILIAALILALHSLGLSLRTISLSVALMFGSFHLTLALAYDNPLYVARYSVAATLFGAIVPYLILKLRNGFLISYAIHWSYYAIDIALIHYVFAAT